MNSIQYTSKEITLSRLETSVTKTIEIPEGDVTHIGLVKEGTATDIVNLEVLQNFSRLLDPLDIRFSEKSNGANFLESLRPVSGIRGGRTLQVRLTAISTPRVADLTVQVVFVTQKPY